MAYCSKSVLLSLVFLCMCYVLHPMEKPELTVAVNVDIRAAEDVIQLTYGKIKQAKAALEDLKLKAPLSYAIAVSDFDTVNLLIKQKQVIVTEADMQILEDTINKQYYNLMTINTAYYQGKLSVEEHGISFTSIRTKIQPLEELRPHMENALKIGFSKT